MEEEHGRIYQKVVAEHERYMQRAVPYKSLRYIRELAEAGKPQEIRAVRLQDGSVTGNKREVMEEVAQNFRRQHNQGQQELSRITRRMVRALPRVFTAGQSEDIHRSRVTLGEIKEALRALNGKKSPGVDQLVAEAYQHLEAPELDGLAGRVTEVLRTGEPPVEWGGKVQPLYKKGDHLRPGNWRPICCAVTEAKPVWMVIFGRIQRRLYAAGVIPDNMWWSVPGRSTQQASFLYDMYLDDEDLEAFMASVDVKGAFPNTPHRLIEEVWRKLGLPYGDFVEKYLRSRRYTVATGKGCTEWVTPGSGVPQGRGEGPFLYLLAMLPLMSWIAREYPQLARAPHTSPAQAYVDDAIPMARDEKSQQVVQDLMQRYGRDNHLVWSTEKLAVLRRGGEDGMALDVGDGVAWLERTEKAVVLGHVQAMEARGVRMPDKLVREFMAMLLVLRHHLPSVQTTLYYLRAVLNVAIGYQGMHLASHGLWLPNPDYVASEDHLAYRNGGLVTAARELVPNQEGQHSGDVPLMCLQELIIAHTGVPGRNDHVVHKGVRTVTHRLKQVLQHPLKSRIAVGNTHGHHLPLEGSLWGAHGCAGTGLIGERHLMITMFQVNHREDPPPVLLLQHVLNEAQRIAVMLRLGV